MGEPTHDLFVVTKKERARGGSRVYNKVGVAYEFEGGDLSIVLDPGTVLDWRLCETHYLNVRRRLKAVSEPPKEAPKLDSGGQT